jgi:rhodanese-related sulfurtransferase
VPKRVGLTRRALLLAFRVFNAVRGFRYEVEPRLRDLFSADDATTVLPALEALECLVDEAEASLEHGLPRDVQLPCLGLARDIGGVLVGHRDLTAAIALRDREALLDAFDRRCEVGTLVLESLAHRSAVHLASVRQNWPVLPQDVSKRRSVLHLLDVREQDEWDAGHIEGAQHIPLGQLAERLAEVPREQVVVAVCRSGSRSDRAAKGLRGNGFEAENLEGGVTAWARAGLPLVAERGGPGRVI